MGYYNDDHPNTRYPQQRPRSAWGARLSGTVGVHDVESIADKVGEDLGAENCANYIATRSDAGGYHELVDSDSFIAMTRDDWMTWHTAAASANGYAWGISGACRTVDWDINDPWTKKTIATMGARIRAFAERNGFPVDKIARWLTKEQAERREIGMYHHGVIQPSDRSDAWVRHPQRAQLDQMLIAAIFGGSTTGDWFDMATKAELKAVLMDDEVLAAIAGKVGEAISGDARIEGQTWAPSKDLGSVEETLTSVVLDQLDPRRPGPGPNPDAKPVRDFIERIPENG